MKSYHSESRTHLSPSGRARRSGVPLKSTAAGILSILALAATTSAAPRTYLPAGAGPWDLATTNWAPPGAGAVWVNNDEATFNQGGGNVTIAAAGVSATEVQFDTTGYAINGPGTLTMVLGANQRDIGGAPGTVSHINAVIAGSDGVDVNGMLTNNGIIIFNGVNTYTGETGVVDGFLRADDSAGLGATGAGNGTVVLSLGGAAVLGFSGGLTTAEEITLQGTGGTYFGSDRGALDYEGFGNGDTSLTGTITLAGGGNVEISAQGSPSADDADFNLNGPIDGTGGENLVFLLNPNGTNFRQERVPPILAFLCIFDGVDRETETVSAASF